MLRESTKAKAILGNGATSGVSGFIVEMDWPMPMVMPKEGSVKDATDVAMVSRVGG